MKDLQLIRKYNVPGPRYTSYPTVPYWNNDSFSEEIWKSNLTQIFENAQSKEISLYIHLPFCESLCTYCGCNTRITVNHQVENPYIECLLKEWKMYLDLFEEKPLIKEIHLGGGTPTFFQAKNLKRLLTKIIDSAFIGQEPAFSFEAHPHNTTTEHLQTLYDLGFRRLSLGIQDFNPDVQAIINRKQSFEEVETISQTARLMGYQSINFDLIYGLPKQNEQSIRDTFEKVKLLKPERIAFYSYAHVPWLKPAQKSLEAFLPQNETKRNLYELGKELLEEAGYLEIGMDHFALPEDQLSQAFKERDLHRNFMGYTTQKTRLLIGLGASAISDAWTAMAQNVKKVGEYQRMVQENCFPLLKGHQLNQEDLILRQHILNLMCQFETQWYDESLQSEVIYEVLDRLLDMEKDGLVELKPFQIKITEQGRPFVRNVCMALDGRMLRKQADRATFSKVV